MSTIIMDLCSYTRLGLTGYLLSRGVKKREINDIETVDDLAIACDSQRPSVVFINEDCFIHDASNSQHIKHIINQHPNTLFIVFMAIANVHFDESLLVRKNLLISSKCRALILFQAYLHMASAFYNEALSFQADA